MSPRIQPGPRVQAVLALVLVAVVSAVIGIAGDRLVAQQRAPDVAAQDRPDGARGPGNGGAAMRPRGEAGSRRMPAGPGSMEVRYAERLGTLIDLTSEQQVAIDSIVVEERRRVRELTRELEPRFREIAEQTRERVESVLTAEQVDQLRSVRRQRTRMLTEQAPAMRPPGMRQRRVLTAPDSVL